MKNNDVIETVKTTIHTHDLLAVDTRAPIVLMVSGGSDSVALLWYFVTYLSDRNLTVLHINHLLRGQDSDADERFVTKLASRLAVRCVTSRIDVAACAAEKGGNLEQVGREIRYQQANKLLDELCTQAGPDPSQARIATAHTLDDRVETFFMRAIVGAGTGALASIPYHNERIIRPLLNCSRSQLQEWLLATAKPDHDDQLWREDASNSDTRYLRAFVRHELIPLAQSRNPELLTTIARSLDTLAVDNSLLVRMAQDISSRFVTEDRSDIDGSTILRIDTALFSEDKALIRRVIHQACNRLLPTDKRITAEHIAFIATNGHRVGFVTDIPGAVTVANEYGTLVIYRQERGGAMADDTGRFILEEGCPGQLSDGRTIVLQRITPSSFLADPVGYARRNSASWRVFIDGSILEQTDAVLEVSPLEAGDRFCPLGMEGHHRLVSDLLIDRKILQRKRQQAAKASIKRGGEEEIVWIIDVLLDDRFKVSEETTSMFSIIINGS